MQPLYEVSLTRPWHWGIVIASAPAASVPNGVGTSLVTATTDAIVIKLRHAQDVDVEVFEGDWDWATATVHIRSLIDLDDAAGEVLYEGTLALPDGRMAVGDADNEVVLSDLNPETRVRIRSSEVEQAGLAEVWIDLIPAAP